MRPHSRFGFTLVELLVVIVIIGILIGLMMPAVNSAREAGRRATCMNNLKQMALACLNHESKLRHLPTGGWSGVTPDQLWGFAGDPERGFDKKQPGGWHYNILPFLEQADLHDNRLDVTGAPGATQDKTVLARLRMQIPVAVFVCPTRHKIINYPCSLTFRNVSGTVQAIARSDYAANAGSIGAKSSSNTDNQDSGDDLANANAPQIAMTISGSQLSDIYAFVDHQFDWSTVDGTSQSATGKANGVIFRASAVQMASIRDGAGNTYLVGERHMDPLNYTTDSYGYDNIGGWDMGYSYDVNRWTMVSPYLDHTPLNNERVRFARTFGSAHTVGFHMAFCDGTVRRMSYDIDPAVHKNLGNRNDGNRIKGAVMDFSEIFK